MTCGSKILFPTSERYYSETALQNSGVHGWLLPRHHEWQMAMRDLGSIWNPRIMQFKEENLGYEENVT